MVEIVIGVAGVAVTLITTLVMAVLAWRNARATKRLLHMLLTGQERAGHIQITRDDKGQPIAIDVRGSLAAHLPTLEGGLKGRSTEEQGGSP